MNLIAFDPLGNYDAGQEYKQKNAFRRFTEERGPDLAAGDPGAIGEYARFDPVGASRLQENAFRAQDRRSQAQDRERNAEAARLGTFAAAIYGVKTPEDYQAAEDGLVNMGLLTREDAAKFSFESLPQLTRMARGVEGQISDERDRRDFNEGVRRWEAEQSKPPNDPIAGLRARAEAAGLQPGTEAYANFMAKGGSSRGFALDVGPDGSVSVRDGAGAGEAPRPFTEAQSKDVGFATRMRGAAENLDKYADSLISVGQRALDNDPTGYLRGSLQTDEYQLANQAGDEWLQAFLRKDSGAAIQQAEQDLYGGTYLPQPGDKPAVLAQKKQARVRAVAAVESGMSPQQALAQERALRESGSAARPPAQLPPGVWEAMTPEERAAFE